MTIRQLNRHQVTYLGMSVFLSLVFWAIVFMGVYWALEAAKSLEGRVSVLDLRTLSPWDKAEVMKQARMHGRVLVLTEEPSSPSFAQSVQGAIQEECFEALDAPVKLLGAENMPAIPLNSTLEKTMLPNELKVNELLTQLLAY